MNVAIRGAAEDEARGVLAAVEGLVLPDGERDAAAERTAEQRLAAIAGAWSALRERLAELEGGAERTAARLEEMLAVVTSLTAFEYDRKISLSEDDDWMVNALALGLNLMGEELARATADLTQARDRALAASRAKSAFLANMSHELRTPLNAIIGYAELIHEELAEGQHAQASADLRKVELAAHHLLNLIKDTLDLSKIEAGKMELVIEEVDLEALLEATMSTLRPMIEARDNALELTVDRRITALRSDRTKLQQIFYNLLSNAAKFTEHGTIAVTTSAAEPGWLTIAVRDTGIGIPQGKLPLIFGAFTQAHETTARLYGGTGLGLTICRHFAEMMGGDLTVESAVGVGSTFSVRLPLADRGRAEGAPEAVLVRNPVIVADRDPRVHDLVRRILGRHGFSVLSATNHHDVIGLMTVVEPVLVILDLEIPNADGWAVLAALKSAPTPTPVLASGDHAERARALALGAHDFVRRPIDPRRIVELALQQRRRPHLGRVLLVGERPAVGLDLDELLASAGWEPLRVDAAGDVAGPFDAILVDARRGLRVEGLPGPAPTLVLAPRGVRIPPLPHRHLVLDADACRGDELLEQLAIRVHTEAPG
ncbi:MAG: ATP-binding protein [Nannocystaceae bacterium]